MDAKSIGKLTPFSGQGQTVPTQGSVSGGSKPTPQIGLTSFGMTSDAHRTTTGSSKPSNAQKIRD